MPQIEAMRAGRQIVPRQVQLIISDLCNQDCHFCSYRSSTGMSMEQFGEDTGKGFTMNPNRMIPEDKCYEILDDCAELGVKAIQFTGGGEPTVHPKHLEIFDYAQNNRLQTSLVTNGMILRKGWESVYSKMSWIRVSLDAGSPATYANVRRVPPRTFRKALDNITAIRDCVNGHPCLLGVGFVVTRENYHEIEQAVALIKDTGAPYVRMSAMFSTMGPEYYADIYGPIKESIARAKREHEDDGFKIVDLFGDRISDLKQHAPDYEFCGYQQFNCYIGGNQKVYRCCTTSYTKHGETGDLSRMRFKEWFESQSKKDRYGTFDARTCELCQFNNQNRTINYMLEPEPLHINFV